MHCRDCKHFGENHEKWEPYKAGWGWCALVASYDKPEHEASLAVAADAESYHAELSVSPDFGCVQFEAKE